MDTKELFRLAKEVWEEQNGKPLEGLHRRRQIGNTQPYDTEDFAEFEKAFHTALQVVGNECGVTSTTQATSSSETVSGKEKIEKIIKGVEVSLKRAKSEADRQKIQAILKGLQVSLKRAK